MEYIFIYLLDIFEKIDVIEGVLVVFMVLATIIWGIIVLANRDYFEEEKEKVIKLKNLLIKCVLITCALCIIPTKQTLLLMGGTYYGKKAIKTVITDEKIKKVDTIINLELDKRIKELQNNTLK